jgi:hypothetical protein
MILNSAKTFAKRLNIDTRALYHKVSRASIEQAVDEQGLRALTEQLRRIVPDLRDQYTLPFDPEEYERYWEVKMRAQHAWQMQCVLDALAKIDKQNLTIVDIGDSSGTHSTYLKAIAPENKIRRCLGVNLDEQAVERIRKKGGEAICSRAEELELHDIQADLFLSFETVEHLTDPLRFLHTLAERGKAQHLVMTVPFRRVSRFGGEHLRMSESVMPPSMTAEEVHIYEFSPQDWTLLVRFAGFRPIFARVYRQYAQRNLSRVTAPLWRSLDLEGFFCVFAERDLSLARRYADW